MLTCLLSSIGKVLFRCFSPPPLLKRRIKASAKVKNAHQNKKERQNQHTPIHTSGALEEQEDRERLSVEDKESERKQRLQDTTRGRRQKEGHS